MKTISPDLNVKKIAIYTVVILILALVCAGLYEWLGYNIIDDMYHGRSLAPLNDLIKYQHNKPVDHYISMANSAFYGILVLGVLLLLVPVYLKAIVSDAVNKGRVSPESVSNVKTIFFLSLALRIIILPLLLNLPTAGDESYYWQLPQSIMAGDFINTVLRPPLWGYMLVIPEMICKHQIAGRALSVLVGSCTPVLVYLLTIKLYNRRTGFLAAILFALYPEHIGYSHYLWSEILLIPLCVTALYFFFSFIKEQHRVSFLYTGFFVAGLALLTKEFALMTFLGMVAVLFFAGTKQKMKRLLIGFLLFILPAVMYSVAISCVTGQAVFFAEAAVGNFRQAAELEEGFNYSIQERESLVQGLVEYLKTRDISATLIKTKEQFFNLWTPNSFPVVRLLSEYVPEKWSYGFPWPWPLVVTSVGFYIFVIVTGLAGICLTKWDHFKTFSITSLLALSMTSVLALLCSRFRFPYMFIFIIYSAYFLTNAKVLLARLKDYKKVIPLLLLMFLFACVLYSKIPTLGQWG